MDGFKGLLQSKAVWGALLSIAAVAASLLGYQLGDADGFANDIVALVGGVIAVYGRIVAVKKISILPPVLPPAP